MWILWQGLWVSWFVPLTVLPVHISVVVLSARCFITSRCHRPCLWHFVQMNKSPVYNAYFIMFPSNTSTDEWIMTKTTKQFPLELPGFHFKYIYIYIYIYKFEIISDMRICIENQKMKQIFIHNYCVFALKCKPEQGTFHKLQKSNNHCKLVTCLHKLCIVRLKTTQLLKSEWDLVIYIRRESTTRSTSVCMLNAVVLLYLLAMVAPRNKLLR